MQISFSSGCSIFLVHLVARKVPRYISAIKWLVVLMSPGFWEEVHSLYEKKYCNIEIRTTHVNACRTHNHAKCHTSCRHWEGWYILGCPKKGPLLRDVGKTRAPEEANSGCFMATSTISENILYHLYAIYIHSSELHSCIHNIELLI